MEFVQFHPTGMVWPPSVQGILVTEGVRGEGGILKNSEGRRFMFDDIPDNYKPQTASDAEEGWRYTQGDKSARRPPELLTRDHVARCINREVKAGRGISARRRVSSTSRGSRRSCRTPRSTSSASCRACTTSSSSWPTSTSRRSRWRSGPTTHYIMGGIRVDADSQMSTIPGLFAAGECASGINGANRLGGNSLSDLIVFGKRAGEYAAAVRARERPAARSTTARSTRGDEGGARAVRARQRTARTRTRSSRTCRRRCRTWSASSASRARCSRRSSSSPSSRRAPRASASRPPRVPPGLAHGARPAQPADGVRSDHAVGDRAEGEPRRPLPRGLSRTRSRSSERSTSWCKQGRGGAMQVSRVPIPPMPDELKQVIEEQKS